MSTKQPLPQVIRQLSLAWLTIIVFFVAGVIMAKEKLWPASSLLDTWDFVVGHPEEDTTLLQKLRNDWGAIPFRHVVKDGERAFPAAEYKAVTGLPLKGDRIPPQIHIAEGAAEGYRLVLGVFQFDKRLHGAILLNPDGSLKNVWQITQDDLTWDHRPDPVVFPHGIDITRDGSIIVAFEAGASLTKYDYCGRKVWAIPGAFHHSVDLLDQDSLWAWGDQDPTRTYGHHLMHIAVKDGAILQEIPMEEVLAANPDTDLFGILQHDTDKGSHWMGDPFHANDIDPLPAELAEHYPQFAVGDLLVSMRSLNLIFVLDPKTKRVKWWRQGIARRQHDPDFNARGTITVYNNNMHRDFSSIVEVDVNTLAGHTLLDGKKYGFYNWHRGKHQELQNGNLLITSPEQGRIFEVNPGGDVVLDYHNTAEKGEGPLGVSEAKFLPLDYFQELPKCAN